MCFQFVESSFKTVSANVAYSSCRYLVKHVPAWFPGASFRIQAEEWRRYIENSASRPYNNVKNAVVCLCCNSSMYMILKLLRPQGLQGRVLLATYWSLRTSQLSRQKLRIYCFGQRGPYMEVALKL